LTLDVRLIGDVDEELRAGAVTIVRHQHRRHRATRLRFGARLCLQDAQPTRPVQVAPGRVLGERITTLNDSVLDRAVERRPVECAVGGELDEIGDMVRGSVRKQIDHDGARRRFDDRLLATKRFGGDGRREKCARRRGRTTCRWLRCEEKCNGDQNQSGHLGILGRDSCA
jgi:hypothetical protein